LSISSVLGTFKNRNIFIIGGSSIYKEALTSPLLKYIFLTRITSSIYENKIIDCDTFFPEIPKQLYRLCEKSEMMDIVGGGGIGNCYFDVVAENGFFLEFLLYTRRNK